MSATIVTDDGEMPLRALPVGELVSAALAVGVDAWWDFVGFLHLRDDQETFDTARSLCGSTDPVRRALGADILAQLGAVVLTADDQTASVPVEDRRFRAPATALLLDLVAAETAGVVLCAAISALGHLGDPRAVGPIARHRGNPDVMVRWTVTLSVTRFADTDDDALAYLVELTTDSAATVRDWSCTGLYTSRRDTPAVRDALLARATDPDAVTRAEALRALAHLGDPRAIEPLLAALAQPAGPDDDPSGESESLLAEALEQLTGDPHLPSQPPTD